MKSFFWQRNPVAPAAPTQPAVIKTSTTTHHQTMEDNAVVLWAQRWLIDFSDAILVRLCQFCLMLGFIAGTIAVLSTRYNINAMPWFNITWAVVQAIAIDGLFFAVWSIWQRSKGQGWLRAWYFFIGILLGCVASLVNDVVSFSELNRVSTISLTMQQLHINESDFSLSRSVLVVLVSILIVTLPRGKQHVQSAPIEQPQSEVEEVAKEVAPAIDIEKVLQTMIAMNQQTLQSVQEQHSQAMNVTIERVINITMETVKEAMLALPIGSAVPQIEAPVQAVDESGTVSISEDEDTIEGSENDAPNSEKIAAILKTNPDLNGRQIAELAGCSERTARKWKGRIQVFTPIENEEG
jgi:hypothetical protein